MEGWSGRCYTLKSDNLRLSLPTRSGIPGILHALCKFVKSKFKVLSLYIDPKCPESQSAGGKDDGGMCQGGSVEEDDLAELQSSLAPLLYITGSYARFCFPIFVSGGISAKRD